MRTSILFVFLVHAVAHGQTPTIPASERSAAVSGIVSNSVDGAPISHARVRFRDFSNNRVYSSVSGIDGTFSFPSIAPGSYSGSVEKRGYLAPPSKLSSNGDVMVELKPGEQVTDFSFQLIPPSVISGHVFDENNEPVENTMVEALRAGAMGSAMTNDRGEFRIGNLRAGRYLIRANSSANRMPPEIRTDGTKESNYGPTFYPGTIDRNSALLVKAEKGLETPNIDIRLARIPIIRVSGQVVGVPKDAKGVSADLRIGNSQQSIRIGPGFNFTMWRMPPGTVWLSAQCQDASGKILQGPEVRIDIADKNIDNVELTLVAPFELRGKVIGQHATMKEARDSSRSRLQLGVGSGFTDVAADGTFKIPALRAGLYRVRLSGLSEREYVKGVRIGFTDYPGRVVDLRNGAPRAPLEIIIGKGAGQIEGIIHDEHGRPAEAMVALLIDDNYEFERPTVTNSSLDGKYVFPDVAPGAYKIFAFEMRDYSAVSSEVDLTVFAPAMRTIEVGPDEKLCQDLDLLPPDD